MTDAEIRALLHELGRRTQDTPRGFLRVSAGELAQRADLKLVAVWIANHGGLVEGAGPYEAALVGRGRWRRRVEPEEETFLVPQRALSAGR